MKILYDAWYLIRKIQCWTHNKFHFPEFERRKKWNFCNFFVWFVLFCFVFVAQISISFVVFAFLFSEMHSFWNPNILLLQMNLIRFPFLKRKQIIVMNRALKATNKITNNIEIHKQKNKYFSFYNFDCEYQSVFISVDFLIFSRLKSGIAWNYELFAFWRALK